MLDAPRRPKCIPAYSFHHVSGHARDIRKEHGIEVVPVMVNGIPPPSEFFLLPNDVSAEVTPPMPSGKFRGHFAIELTGPGLTFALPVTAPIDGNNNIHIVGLRATRIDTQIRAQFLNLCIGASSSATIARE